MNKVNKVIATVLVVVVFFVVFAVIVGIRTDNGRSTPGIIGLAVGIGAIAALRTIWKNDSSDNK